MTFGSGISVSPAKVSLCGSQGSAVVLIFRRLRRMTSVADIGESYGKFPCLHGAVDALLLAEHGMPILRRMPKLSETLNLLHVLREW